ERPNIPASLTRHFAPGTYRIISMPEPVAARRLTLFEHIQQPLKREGHGPHPLPLAQHIEHVWMEPSAGGTRDPDIWEFTLPAAVDATLDLNNEMEGTLDLVLDLVNENHPLPPVAQLPPGRGWKGTLGAGHYRLATRCARTDNRHPYAIALWPE